jgi:predicted HicB family RNase H-like nuclease
MEQVQLKLRFNERLRRKLEKAAARNGRSLNSEIIDRLERSLSDEDILAKIHQCFEEFGGGF